MPEPSDDGESALWSKVAIAYTHFLLIGSLVFGTVFTLLRACKRANCWKRRKTRGDGSKSDNLYKSTSTELEKELQNLRKVREEAKAQLTALEFLVNTKSAKEKSKNQ